METERTLVEWLRAEPEAILDAWRRLAAKLVRSLGPGSTEVLREADDLLHEAVVKLLESGVERYRAVPVGRREAQAMFGGFVRGHYANLRRRVGCRDLHWHELMAAVAKELAGARRSSGRHRRTDG